MKNQSVKAKITCLLTLLMATVLLISTIKISKRTESVAISKVSRQVIFAFTDRFFMVFPP